jgi:hypothetical protein
MQLNLKVSKRSLMSIPNRILLLSEICHLKLVKLFGQDIFSRKLLDLFINSQRLPLPRMNCKLNLLVIIQLVLNSKFMSSGSSELGVKKLKELKLDYKLLSLSENLKLDLFMLISILLSFSLFVKPNVLKDNTFKFQKLPELFSCKKKNSKCTLMSFNMS